MHGCSSHCILLEHERNYGLGMDVEVTRILLEHERNCGLDMDHLYTLETLDGYGCGNCMLSTGFLPIYLKAPLAGARGCEALFSSQC